MCEVEELRVQQSTSLSPDDIATAAADPSPSPSPARRRTHYSDTTQSWESKIKNEEGIKSPASPNPREIKPIPKESNLLDPIGNFRTKILSLPYQIDEKLNIKIPNSTIFNQFLRDLDEKVGNQDDLNAFIETYAISGDSVEDKIKNFKQHLCNAPS